MTRHCRLSAAMDADVDSPRLDWLHAEACRLIHAQHADPAFDVDRLVALLACSRPTVYRAFARRGQTVAAAIRQARLEHGRALLATPPFRLPIDTLAYRCGFEETRTFTRVFRQVFGMSPGQYRDHAAGRALVAVPQGLASTQPSVNG